MRMNLSKTHKKGCAAVLGLEAYASSSVPKELYELVKLRASILNGCSFCTDMHSHDALNMGIPAAKLFAVAAYNDSPLFSEAERAALRLTDEVTRLDAARGVSDKVFNEAAEEFSEEEIGNLILAIATINVWNRIAITTQLEPPVRG
ncbi:carboxymuconolactone decarboxylase family protein [Arthrobacter sp. NIO-1057]|uniref:carboxymuconolactone decarboxylase family protein n=1 Tax=Arthrobacter sp. NIO-1057 TaxID=993071 RepID=UPI00071D544C|nr:carboxymuconolactone decarboxylase family protein [Arthrobacter sp. NIO-1057]KSU65377.1 alkylhydroperoxidase [Arthrobacter sp. NIO-1057]SCC45347.1 alkylhydroperoxidase AhpD family core domain-containing protein [Arthrobacter sp. NIO-1057]